MEHIKEVPELNRASAEDSTKPNRTLQETFAVEGYVTDIVDARFANVNTASDGHTILIPHPSDNPNDPLNWSPAKKHVILLIVSFAAFLPDYGSGIFVVALSAWAGRLPILFYFLAIAAATAAWCAAATTFESFMAARILNGFFSTVAQGGGLMFIFDMFFFHERARKINIWAAFIILSPYMGPLITAFIITTEPWPIAFWVYFIETSIALILTILFVRETYYDRRIAPADQPPQGSCFGQLLGTAQFKSRHLRSTFGQACMRPIRVIIKPTVFLSVIYYFLTFAWVVGINTTVAIFLTPLYNFGPKQIGFFYFTPIVAALIGEIAGHWLHDGILRIYSKKQMGRFEPEVRLWAMWLSTPFMIAGLIGLGFCLEDAYHYMLTSLFWGLYVFGIMISTVALNAYNLDSYPEASGEVSAWINFARSKFL
ncbi:hypothetical protein N0V87_010444 [Didymella glomerata]|uniref:Major facilitator superfamily (MFS) profile domain-containing protein n=1 Tax=Didymella glomerata TaxID=749621 RepID=A0A9W8WP69_9PLEO|nr:hypothetical protein N0V87_010444 [Didymella glomerata]